MVVAVIQVVVTATQVVVTVMQVVVIVTIFRIIRCFAVQDGHLPMLIVTAEKLNEDSVRVSWKNSSNAKSIYRLMGNTVNVVGQKFRKNVNSDYR